MLGKTLRRSSHLGGKRQIGEQKGKVVHRFVERDLIHRVSYTQYRDKVRDIYGGRRGAMLTKFSSISGHLQLGERLLRQRRFDLRGVRNILDVGSGAGQVLGHMLKYADPEASMTGFDISSQMLLRARRRLKSDRPRLIAADLAQLPFKDGSFDCVTCCYVLEHRVGRVKSRDGARRSDAAVCNGGQF